MFHVLASINGEVERLTRIKITMDGLLENFGITPHVSTHLVFDLFCKQWVRRYFILQFWSVHARHRKVGSVTCSCLLKPEANNVVFDISTSKYLCGINLYRVGDKDLLLVDFEGCVHAVSRLCQFCR